MKTNCGSKVPTLSGTSPSLTTEVGGGVAAWASGSGSCSAGGSESDLDSVLSFYEQLARSTALIFHVA